MKWVVIRKVGYRKQIVIAPTAWKALWSVAGSKKEINKYMVEEWLDHDDLQEKNIIVLGYDTNGIALTVQLPEVKT